MDVRIERPFGVDLLQPLRRERRGQRRPRHLDACEHLCLLVMLGRLERTLEVVEHGQELGDEPLGGPGGECLLVAERPLAVVVEVRGKALQIGEVLVPLCLRLGQGSASGRPGP